MLIRRFTKHVTEQNWFAVGLDFIVVVIGIIIGLQVSNWNEERQAKDTVKNYYRHLVNELGVKLTGICNLELTDKIKMKQIKKLKSYKNLEFDLTYRVSDIDWKIDNYKIFNFKAEQIIANLKELQTD